MKVRVQPTLIDRAVALVNPAAGVARVKARAQMAAASAMFGGGVTGGGGYRGGQVERGKRRGWFARSRSANADTLPGADRLRAESRDAAMNQPIATAAINRDTTFAIGTGLMAIPTVDGEALGLTDEETAAWNRRISADFDAYMASRDVDAERSATGYGLQAVSYRGVQTSGDILKLRVMPEDQPGRVVQTAWKLIEADRLRNPPGVGDGARDSRTGNRIAGGVELDDYGAPIAYHVLKQHPGDLLGVGALNPTPERIEAWDRDLNLPRVVHVYRKDRPEQVRGVGMLATVLEQLRMISDLTDAELFASVMSAMIAVVYKSPGAGPMPEPDFGDAEAGAGGDGADGVGGYDVPPPANEYRFEAGSVMEIDSEADVEIKSPGRPNSAFDPFFQAIVRQIGAATGLPFGVLMLMFNSSYTASKAELETLYLKVRVDRYWFGGIDCLPTYECFLAEKVASGAYDMPGFFADLRLRAAWMGANWRGDGKISLNIAQEANGLKIQQDNGWKTGEEITAELTGGSFHENVRKRGAEHRAWVAEGLPVAVSPGTPAETPAEKPKKPDQQEDEDA